jgi:hypothetical protein
MATTEPGSAGATESRIPKFNSIEDEAGFWDTHSFEEFADELEEVDDHMFVGILRNGILTVRFKGAELTALEAAAAQEGTNAAALAYTWVLERLGLAPEIR